MENYIEECLHSVVRSMGIYENIQVILVNDGTKDCSGEIAQKFASNYSQFDYFEKENGGLSDARNFGLQYAKYDYVAFLDSDDLIEENFFSVLLQQITHEPDLIIFDFKAFGKSGDYTVKGMEIPSILWTVQPSAWCKVYKKSLFGTVQFPVGMIYEDVGTTYKLLHFVHHFAYVNQALYNYREFRDGSIMNTVSPKINDIYKALEDTYSFYAEQNALTKENVEGLSYHYIKQLLWSNMYRQLKFYKLDYLSFYKKMNETKKLIDTRFNKWRTNSMLRQNEAFFIDRFGNQYMKKMDGLGNDFIGTLFILCSIVLRNVSRLRKKG